jgi:hypothetical protein
MNKNVKRIITESFAKATQGKQINVSNLESVIDAYVLDVVRATVFECSDVLREKAKNETDAVTVAMLKVSAVDVLDHFGL